MGCDAPAACCRKTNTESNLCFAGVVLQQPRMRAQPPEQESDGYGNWLNDGKFVTSPNDAWRIWFGHVGVQSSCPRAPSLKLGC
jgi:hypothetical protein